MRAATLHVRAPRATGRHVVYDGRWLQLERTCLGEGATLVVRPPARDECVVVRERGEVEWNGVGARRSSPFEERASAAYVPPAAELVVQHATDTRLVVATSRFGDVEPDADVVLVGPPDVTVQVRGRDAWERDVHDAERPTDRPDPPARRGSVAFWNGFRSRTRHFTT